MKRIEVRCCFTVARLNPDHWWQRLVGTSYLGKALMCPNGPEVVVSYILHSDE